MTTITHIPLDKLLPGDKAKGGSINSRKADAPVDGLAASIAQHGLLVPLLVRIGDGDKFYVMDGNRRLAALGLLAKDRGKKIKVTAAMPVLTAIPCIENDSNNALELSMVVNIDREELHPVDRFEVFAALVEGGDTVDGIAKRYRLTVKQVRQALALGRMAPAVRDAWRSGVIDADVAEAFTITADHKAQTAALKKAGKFPDKWSVRRALTGVDTGSRDTSALLAIVGRAEYEKAGHQINETLFSDNDEPNETVSDFPALKAMADAIMAEKCSELLEQGWKWAILKADAPNDLHAWKRAYPEGNTFSKAAMANLGCVVGLDHNGKLEISRGYVKPGDKIATPKSPKQKKVEAKQREERKEETGGLSNALALRLSKQLTGAMREAFAGGVSSDNAVALAIAALACSESPMKIVLHGDENVSAGRHRNDFVKYYKLARGKSHAERCLLLATWIGGSIDLTSYSAPAFVSLLDPGKDDDKSARLIAMQIDPVKMRMATFKHFDAADYFASVSKELIVEAVTEAKGKETGARVAKMKLADARDFAAKNTAGWLPKSMRLGKGA